MTWTRARCARGRRVGPEGGRQGRQPECRGSAGVAGPEAGAAGAPELSPKNNNITKNHSRSGLFIFFAGRFSGYVASAAGTVGAIPYSRQLSAPRSSLHRVRGLFCLPGQQK